MYPLKDRRATVLARHYVDYVYIMILCSILTFNQQARDDDDSNNRG